MAAIFMDEHFNVHLGRFNFWLPSRYTGVINDTLAGLGVTQFVTSLALTICIYKYYPVIHDPHGDLAIALATLASCSQGPPLFILATTKYSSKTENSAYMHEAALGFRLLLAIAQGCAVAALPFQLSRYNIAKSPGFGVAMTLILFTTVAIVYTLVTLTIIWIWEACAKLGSTVSHLHGNVLANWSSCCIYWGWLLGGLGLLRQSTQRCISSMCRSSVIWTRAQIMNGPWDSSFLCLCLPHRWWLLRKH